MPARGVRLIVEASNYRWNPPAMRRILVGRARRHQAEGGIKNEVMEERNIGKQFASDKLRAVHRALERLATGITKALPLGKAKRMVGRCSQTRPNRAGEAFIDLLMR